MKKHLLQFLVTLFLGTSVQAQTLGQGERADWMRGSWGALWLPKNTFNGNIEGVTIDAFLAQIADLQTIDYVQVALANPSIFSPNHAAPHPILESLWQGDTDSNGDPINLVVPRASAPDPFLSWLEALNEAGLKSEVYVNSYNLLARTPGSIPDDFPDFSARWTAYCDTDPTFQEFINNHPYIAAGDPVNRKYMFCYAEFILKEYAVRYGDLIDAWTFDSAHNIMGSSGDDEESGLVEDQRIYEAFANACHAGNPNAAISFNNGVGDDTVQLAPPTRFDDYAFGHPFGGAGNMVVPESLYIRNFAICELMQEHNGLPFVTTDSRAWNDDVVGHFFPKQSTTSWSAGATPCLTDEQFVEWTAEGVVNGGAITWGTPLVRTNLENNAVLTLQPYALNQLELADAHLSEFQFPGTPNWRRAETPLTDARVGVTYSHTLTDGFDFWDPSGGSITSVSMIGQPSWLTVAESSPGSGVWMMSGNPTETVASEYSFEIQIAIGAEESSRTVELVVVGPPSMPMVSRSIEGGATWGVSGIERVYDNNGTGSTQRALSYSSQLFQSNGGFKLTASYQTGSIGDTGEHNFSFGLISSDTDLSTYTGLNPFGADTSVYSLGVNLTTDLGGTLRGLNFTDGSAPATLDTSGTNVEFASSIPTPFVIEVDEEGAWSYSINGIIEASGVISGGFDLSKNYRVAVYGQDDNGGGKSIQSLSLELTPNPTMGLLADWRLDDNSTFVTDSSGNGFHATASNTSSVSGVLGGAFDFNGSSSTVSLPAEAFASISSEITVAMWVHGAASQARKDAVFQAYDGSGNRVLNIHLPWSDSMVIWDAGNGGTPLDRISKTATSSQFKERWNHWVFTKKASSGAMQIFLNGSLWHSDVGFTREMSGVTQAVLGSGNGVRHYDGLIDEVKLYDVALSASEVSELHGSYEGFAAWLSRHPAIEEIGTSADEDGDEIELLLEYVLNGNPLESDFDIFPTVDSSGGSPVFKFTRLAESADDTEQVFQYSTNLVDWSDLKITGEQAPEISIGDEVNGTEEVSITLGAVLASEGRLFGRLRMMAK